MSIEIKTINLNEKESIHNRNVSVNGSHVQSVNIYQTDGSFITTEPFNNRLIWYPQSPNNVNNTLLGKWKTFDFFSGYGYLSFPLDARFDYVRRILWIADSGNQRILQINIDSGTVTNTINNGYLSHSVILDINNGDVFIKSIKDKMTGIIEQYSVSCKLLNSFEFACNYGIAFEDIQKTNAFISSIPLPSSMVFDNSRRRLWWTGDNYVYMADTLNKNIVANNLNAYVMTRGIDIDCLSGNAFVIAARKLNNSQWHVVQISKDNNSVISHSYLPEVI